MRAAAEHLLRHFYATAIARIDGERVVRDVFRHDASNAKTGVVAIGKAAPAMLAGALSELGDRVVAALLVAKRGQVDTARFQDRPVEIIEAGHPVPDRDSFRAGDRLCEFLESLPPDARVVILLSGGTSSLVEVLPPGVTQDDLARLNRYLLGSGADIGTINTVRVAVSGIKGGGLLNRLTQRTTEVWFLSDLQDDDPRLLGSGLLWPWEATLPTDLPDWAEEIIGRVGPRSGLLDMTPPLHHLIGTQDDAREAIGTEARRHGLHFQNHGRALYGGVEAVSSQLIETMAESLDSKQPTVHVWSGEPTVVLPENPGQGGRNQHLALQVARGLAGSEGWCLLAAGSDGDDAETGAAGAIVRGHISEQVAAKGFDVDDALASADSYTVLAACDALLVTGPTGTNVTDLAIAITGCGANLDRSCPPVHTELMDSEALLPESKK